MPWQPPTLHLLPPRLSLDKSPWRSDALVALRLWEGHPRRQPRRLLLGAYAGLNVGFVLSGVTMTRPGACAVQGPCARATAILAAVPLGVTVGTLYALVCLHRRTHAACRAAAHCSGLQARIALESALANALAMGHGAKVAMLASMYGGSRPVQPLALCEAVTRRNLPLLRALLVLGGPQAAEGINAAIDYDGCTTTAFHLAAALGAADAFAALLRAGGNLDNFCPAAAPVVPPLTLGPCTAVPLQVRTLAAAWPALQRLVAAHDRSRMGRALGTEMA